MAATAIRMLRGEQMFEVPGAVLRFQDGNALQRFAVRCAVVVSALLIAAAPARAQERIDAAFQPTIAQPEYPIGQGPLVLVDRAHHNFHAGAEQFEQLARLLQADGYRVRGLRERFSATALAGADVLVVVNAVASREDKEWRLPTTPAFGAHEVEAVREWVERGGSLLLIADHMPFPGASDALARVFGIEFLNGFAIVWEDWEPLVYRRADGTLPAHPITDGRRTAERVAEAVSFVSGSAFRPLSSARCVSPVLVFGPGVFSYQPERAWQFTDATPRVPVEGWLQGATLEPGRGRVAVFGEAAMFAAQLTGSRGQRVGMNSPRAPQNLQFLLNTFHWLSRAPGYGSTPARRC
jgi:hypothetical protein